MNSISPLSNYIVDQMPACFGNQQKDYIEKRDAVIAEKVLRVKASAKSKQTFNEVCHAFEKIRYDLAIAHGTDLGFKFGRNRLNTCSTAFYTPLADRYRKFNPKILEVFKDPLKSYFENNKKNLTKESYALGRKSSIEVKVLTFQDIREEEWDTDHPSFDLPAKHYQVIEEIPKKLIDIRTHLFPTSNEKILINELKNHWKFIKQNFNKFYICYKMNYCFSEMERLFPKFQQVFSNKGHIEILHNINHIKSIYVMAKVRIEIQGKMYALSEYIAWTHQDHKIDPIKRLNHSTTFILHQDQFLIEDTLKEIASLFEQVIQWDFSKQTLSELKEQVALIRYLFAHCAPYQRGSSAIGEWLEILIYKINGFKCQHNPETIGDLEALTAPLLSDFLKVYDSTIILSKI